MKYKTINGYTKESMIEAIMKGNKGYVARQGSTCKYLTSDGNKCAVGCFIPDGHVAQTHEGSVRILIRDYNDIDKFFPINPSGMHKLQSIHDKINEASDPRPALVQWINENVE